MADHRTADIASALPEPVLGRGETPAIGTLTWLPALDHPELLAEATHAALVAWARSVPAVATDVVVAEVDPALSDTSAMSEAYQIPMSQSVNCVLVTGKREGVERTAAAAVRASTRADVNGTVKALLDVRKASFAPVDRAVAESGMEYGGITPIGLPASWPVLLDAGAREGWIVIGSGVRRSKIALPGHLLATLPGLRVVEGLARD
ncbi:YbaK/EbsC family protein [Sanguibacter suarezii]|uniref:YbaK/EbsC family protein n=1 Tax=Sanguibacter suarezii TaxID=60921 RepID=UPI0009FC6D1F|nr:YbaK/EbsC family protein [Sanguibacter suarezii]